MQVTKNITLDLLETGSPVIIKAKQNDRNTRYIAAHLYVDGLSYPVPSGTEQDFMTHCRTTLRPLLYLAIRLQ